MSDEEIIGTLRAIQETLKRIEERQIKTTAMVTEVKAQEPVVGSFGASDLGDPKT